MQPTEFKEQNMTWRKPEDMTDEECGNLHVHYSKEMNCSVSCWEMTPEEIEEVKQTGKIWVFHVGDFLQPLSLQVQNPFYPKVEGKEIEEVKSKEESEKV